MCRAICRTINHRVGHMVRSGFQVNRVQGSFKHGQRPLAFINHNPTPLSTLEPLRRNKYSERELVVKTPEVGPKRKRPTEMPSASWDPLSDEIMMTLLLRSFSELDLHTSMWIKRAMGADWCEAIQCSLFAID